MKSAEIKTALRLLEAAKRDKSPGFRERITICPGVDVDCYSLSQRHWWEQFRDHGLKPISKEFSLRDTFEATVKDGREMVESWNPKFGPSSAAGWQEAAGAVMSSDFSNITGPVIYNEMMDRLTPEETVFQNLIPTVPTQFNGERIPGIAGLGDTAEIVAENDEFPLVGFGEDWIDTPQTTKRGHIVPVTKEALFFDRTQLIREEAGKVGESLTLNKEKRAIDCVIDENTTAHRHNWRGTVYATYQTTTPWDNVTASNALVDWTDIDNIEQTQNAMLDPHTGEPIVIGADTLIAVTALSWTARHILNATQVQIHYGGYVTSGNPTTSTVPNPYGGAFKFVTSRLLASRLATDTDYFFGSPSKALRYMQNWPITVTQAPVGNSDDFNRDIVLKFKASERGQYYVKQPRLMGKATVA
jgi:hypothetical protein